MSIPKQTVFYADYVAFRLERAAKRINRVLFYIVAILFMVVFIGLIFQAGNTGEYIDSFQNYVANHIPYDEPLRFLILPLLLWLTLPWLPEAVRLLRKYILYPKKTLTRQAFVSIESKEIIVHPRTARSRASSRSHYIKVRHPSTGKLIHFDVDQALYEKLPLGNLVDVNYHPVEGNVLCLIAGVSQ
jgi:hypothetical protein